MGLAGHIGAFDWPFLAPGLMFGNPGKQTITFPLNYLLRSTTKSPITTLSDQSESSISFDLGN